jgi:hypothetical protein
MSFLKKLFGGGGGAKEMAEPKRLDYKGFVITAAPYSEGGQYQTCGVISKEIEGVRKEHKFIRADRFSSLEEAQDFALSKGQQIVDSMGERMFT